MINLLVLKETVDSEKRVALVPDEIKKYLELGFKITIEKDAGIKSGFLDEDYRKLNANISQNVEKSIKEYQKIIKKYKIKSIEDPFAENDWMAWNKLMKSIKKIQIVGDDLYVTNLERLKKGFLNLYQKVPKNALSLYRWHSFLLSVSLRQFLYQYF